MKIILNFVDISEEGEKLIIEWIKGIIANKDPQNTSPLRYVDTLEVQKP